MVFFFRNLLKVTGVGARMALAILSGISASDFARCVQEDDTASLVKLPDYPYALEVSEETYEKNVEMFRYITKEADKRGIWVVQMFYNIILSTHPFHSPPRRGFVHR